MISDCSIVCHPSPDNLSLIEFSLLDAFVHVALSMWWASIPADTEDDCCQGHAHVQGISDELQLLVFYLFFFFQFSFKDHDMIHTVMSTIVYFCMAMQL